MAAVEFLYNNLKSYFEHDGDLLEVVKFSFEQAKQIEKKHIFDAYKEGCFDKILDEKTDTVRAEEYYKQIFKNK